MALRPIVTGDVRDKNQTALNRTKVNNPNFTGGFNPINATMDAINSGGYIASFFAQDCIGTIIPRIYEGANRNKEETGQYNWAFAKKEALRELLSGPCMFIIPLGIFTALKRKIGPSVKVPVDRINVYGNKFAEFAGANKKLISENPKLARQEFYTDIFRDMLTESTGKEVSKEFIDKEAERFAKRFITAENSKSKGFFRKITNKAVEGSKEDIISEIANKFVNLRKSSLAPTASALEATISSKSGAKATGSFKAMLSSLTEFTNDAMKTASKNFNLSKEFDAEKFVKTFTKKRMGTRILSNFGIYALTVSFMTQVPKLYNMGQKENPGLAGLDVDKKENSNPNFTGKSQLLEKTANKVTKTGWLKKLSDKFEFEGASMTPTQCLILLFGFCLPPRIANAQDKHDRKEIIVRDISSFIAILFAARGLSRVFSRIMGKISGLALNVKPENFKNQSIFKKAHNYVTSGNGIHVLGSEELVAKYSGIDKYKNGINGFFEFIEQNGGDIKKTLKSNKIVKANTEKLIGKSIKDASAEEIKLAFNKARANNSQELQEIYKVFEKPNNSYVNKAKTLNSTFDFLSTLVIVPAFMMWLAKFCERMTKKDIENEKLANEAYEAELFQVGNLTKHQIRELATKQPTMEGFLGRNAGSK